MFFVSLRFKVHIAIRYNVETIIIINLIQITTFNLLKYDANFVDRCVVCITGGLESFKGVGENVRLTMLKWLKEFRDLCLISLFYFFIKHHADIHMQILKYKMFKILMWQDRGDNFASFSVKWRQNEISYRLLFKDLFYQNTNTTTNLVDEFKVQSCSIDAQRKRIQKCPLSPQ